MVEDGQITCMMEKQRTGAATLLIHMLAIIPTNMLTSNTVRGLVPALLKTKVAMSFAMEYLERAAAIVKPPNSNIMTGVHMEAKTYLVASFGPNRLYGFWSDRTICNTTTRKGTSSDVTNSGMTCRIISRKA